MLIADVAIDRLGLDRLAGGGLRLLPAERAHRLALQLLAVAPAPGRPPTPQLARVVAGLGVPNPIGVAAGFDKDGEVFEHLLDWGFGFVEVGTVTPRPQAGNPQPRLFRLPADGAVINRMGFNNAGHAALARRLQARDRSRGIVGVNIGCNKDSDEPIGDFVLGVRTFAPLADYLTVNVSSPNTPGLRDLQHGQALERLLDGVLDARETTGAIPLFGKLAPDLDDAQLEAILGQLAARPLAGVVYANTTTHRPDGLSSAHANEPGGLSGRPLLAATTARLTTIRKSLRDDQVLVGVGGIASAADIHAKLAAGADLVQLYTGLVYQGLGLARRALRTLEAAPLYDAQPER